ncbi:hypothetical protein PAAG_08011 [Paracoccidioides lutzii Pb01]|uniref:Uncharacterized protein n=1 Tax=Paracoccidioides lutzii (strain ATCC MYA-826 / Pb01) TaxID=502779 RepID=C1HB70_PARBA|nr:hypothetical protein PAAG_08011 [Paracoccidioides lutzii Pb01]EEH37593.1 hypothetical protein PAAG_08011 [Paracoccidioides lutzii Pb01]
MAAAVVYPHLISKIADPLFAVFIGTSAAFVRIRREHKEKHPDQPADARYLFNLGTTRVKRWWGGWSE